ncbi:MAG: hypothetical protein R6U38_16890 [Desulfatiglandaceae bacterium]
MNHRILKVLICMAVVLGLASHGLCAVFAKHPPEPPCQKASPADKRIGLETTGQCKMPPCHAREGQTLFLLADASVGRSKTQDRQTPQPQGPAFILESLTLFSYPQGAAAVLKAPLTLNPPPLFYLHCALIC